MAIMNTVTCGQAGPRDVKQRPVRQGQYER